MASDVIRIEGLTPAEADALKMLTPQERKTALVTAAREKQRVTGEQLKYEHFDRVQRGEIPPQTVTDGGYPFPTNGREVFYQNTKEPMEDIGRVPGFIGMHVLRRADGSLFLSGGYHLRRNGEIWQDVFDTMDDD